MEGTGLLGNFTKYVGFNIVGMISLAVCVFVDYRIVSIAMGTDGLTFLGLV